MTIINEHLCLHHAGAILDKDAQLEQANKRIQELVAENNALKLQAQIQDEKFVAENETQKKKNEKLVAENEAQKKENEKLLAENEAQKKKNEKLAAELDAFKLQAQMQN